MSDEQYQATNELRKGYIKMRYDTLEARELTRLSVKRCVRFLLICELIYIVLYTLVLNPLYTTLQANVLYQNAWWMDLLGLSIDILDYVPFILCYPACLYALWVGGWRHGYPPTVWLAGLTVAKYLINYAVGVYVALNAWPSLGVLADDMSLILPALLLELLQLAVVLGLCSLHRGLHRMRQLDAIAEAALRQRPYAPPTLFPMTRLLDRRNPVQRSLLDAALAVTVMSLLLRRLVYQLTLYAYYGKLDSWLQIGADVVGDLLAGVVMYLVGILLVDRFARRDGRTGAGS